MIFDGIAMSHEHNSRVWIGSRRLRDMRGKFTGDAQMKKGETEWPGQGTQEDLNISRVQMEGKNSKPALMLRESVSVQERRWILDDV